MRRERVTFLIVLAVVAYAFHGTATDRVQTVGDRQLVIAGQQYETIVDRLEFDKELAYCMYGYVHDNRVAVEDVTEANITDADEHYVVSSCPSVGTVRSLLDPRYRLIGHVHTHTSRLSGLSNQDKHVLRTSPRYLVTCVYDFEFLRCYSRDSIDKPVNGQIVWNEQNRVQPLR